MTDTRIEAMLAFARASGAVEMAVYADHESYSGRLSRAARDLALAHAAEALDEWEAIVDVPGFTGYRRNPFVWRGCPAPGNVIRAILDRP